MGEPSERAFHEFMKEVYLPTLAQDELVEEGSLRLHRIQPLDLSNLFFVKAKNGNQRIANQMGAFLILGLGVKRAKASGSGGEVNLLSKSEHTEVPAEWIKKKLIIPKERKSDILKELALLGITESYIYPGIEQYSKELKERYNL